MKWSIPSRTVAAKNGDTHITGTGLEQTVDCNGATLLVDGTRNTVNALELGMTNRISHVGG